MSNQRNGTTHKAALGNDNRISFNSVLSFLEDCAIALEKDEPDSAFYFNQIVEHIKTNPHKAFSEKADKVLGL
jgi:hypothetical protein